MIDREAFYRYLALEQQGRTAEVYNEDTANRQLNACIDNNYVTGPYREPPSFVQASDIRWDFVQVSSYARDLFGCCGKCQNHVLFGVGDGSCNQPEGYVASHCDVGRLDYSGVALVRRNYPTICPQFTPHQVSEIVITRQGVNARYR